MRSTNPLYLGFFPLAVAILAIAELAFAAPPPTGAASASASSSAAASASGPRGRALPPPGEPTNTCASCHGTLTDVKLRAPAREFAGSVHRDERIGCVGCHKGDPRDPTVGAHAPATGFQPHPTHAEVPQICGSCHSDAAFMRRINGRLPVGQAALFNLSLHGKLTAAGDENAPDCSVCHGKHDILPPSSPRSPVNRANVAKLCGSCHGDMKKMAKYGIRTDQFSKWEASVHGQAFAKGNPNAPTCTGCHGAHSSSPPDSASVAHACGRCHEDEMNFFEQSPHSKGFRKRGFAQCVVCHGNHDIAPASASLIGTTQDAACMKCHTQDEKPRQVADEIAQLLRNARDRAAEARAAVERAHTAGVHVTPASFALDKVTTAELKVRGVVHTLDPSRVAERVSAVESAATEAINLVSDAERVRKNERRGYFVALALAGLLLVTLALKAVQLERRRRQGAP